MFRLLLGHFSHLFAQVRIRDVLCLLVQIFEHASQFGELVGVEQHHVVLCCNHGNEDRRVGHVQHNLALLVQHEHLNLKRNAKQLGGVDAKNGLLQPVQHISNRVWDRLVQFYKQFLLLLESRSNDEQVVAFIGEVDNFSV